MLITVLIDKIYLYDDYAIIFFNTQEKEYNVKVPTIEEAEVRTNDISAHQDKASLKACFKNTSTYKHKFYKRRNNEF